MKKFIIKILQFFTLVALVVIMLQIIIGIRVNNKSTTGHDNLDLTSNVNSEIIFMGSSRCWAHFDPVFFEKEFNLKSTNIGIDGHSELSMVYARLLDYLKYNSSPKYAIINFDPFISGGNISKKTTNEVHKDNFARYAFSPINDDWETVKHFGFDNWEKYFPLYAVFKYKQISNCLFQNNISTYVKYGYGRNEQSWDTIKEPIDGSLVKYYRIKDRQFEVKNVINQINELCIANGIKLILVQTPVHNSIYEKEMFEIPEGIAEELNILFIDANYDMIKSETKYFYNSNHLNVKGVEIMNSNLKKDLLEILK
jgi:hypothetical protein